VANILAFTVETMIKQYRCNPSQLMAAIGPSLGPCCAEFREYEALFPDAFSQFKVGPNHFNLWKISQWQLTTAGIDEGNIEVAGICTKCSHEFFFSHRAEGITGRFATVAMVNS
jgi:copper oxidase (laccase) domain-containing protein